MRRALVPGAVVLAIVLLTLGALLLRAATTSTTVQQTNGVPTVAVVGYARPGISICQEGVALREPTDRLAIWATGRLAPSPPFRVTVTETGTERVLARGRGPAAPVESRRFRLRMDRVIQPDRPISVCVRSEGPRLLGLIGQVPDYAVGPFGIVTPRQEVLRRVRDDGRTRELQGDMRVEAYYEEPRSTLSRLPAALGRAAEFKPAGVSAAVWWVAGLLLVLGVPLALVRALGTTQEAAGAVDEQPPAEPSPPRPPSP